MAQDKDWKWQEDTDPRQKDDRSELLKKTGTEELDERKERQDKKEDEPFIWGTGSDGGAEGDGAAA
jgi:hypothetical protein